ncbi:Acetyltransferase (GNAT) family protein [Pseudovibrio sp. Ad46]|uniref:GNAT family N-acetyltransferase n=1 Tax=Pseudovibrio sp. Ad46 TaxID=989432 RepID=UPI0007AE6622|nr:GNAT family N-acetyltransferase [Pseudovibrio sp. Ad46]KZK77196.1 Acetyltransferase (GNAT) family protein [Pseudovibrio sp. Ad46]
MAHIQLDLDGYTDLPEGKVATVVTHLEMLEKPALKPIDRPDLTLERAGKIDITEYRALFKRVGEPWLWFGRLVMNDAELEATLSRPTNEFYWAMKNGEPVGMLELDVAKEDEVTLSYFGLVPEAVGGGAGRWLMNHAISKAFSRPEVKRFWLHTCTGDSPQALQFYLRSGFKPFKRSIEVADDPRLNEILDRSCAPHIPFLP